MKNSIKASVDSNDLTPEAKDLLISAGSNDKPVAMRAQAQIAKGIAAAYVKTLVSQMIKPRIKPRLLDKTSKKLEVL